MMRASIRDREEIHAALDVMVAVARVYRHDDDMLRELKFAITVMCWIFESPGEGTARFEQFLADLKRLGQP